MKKEANIFFVERETVLKEEKFGTECENKETKKRKRVEIEIEFFNKED